MKELGNSQVPTSYISDDEIPVVYTPTKYPIAIRPLVDKKLDKLLEEEVIVPVIE